MEGPVLAATIGGIAAILGIIIGKWGDLIINLISRGEHRQVSPLTKVWVYEAIAAHADKCPNARLFGTMVTDMTIRMASKEDINNLATGVRMLAEKWEKHLDWHLEHNHT